MADITLASRWTTPTATRRPALLDAIAHRAAVLRRRARRNRYLALTGRLPRTYPWLEVMFQAMRGR